MRPLDHKTSLSPKLPFLVFVISCLQPPLSLSQTIVPAFVSFFPFLIWLVSLSASWRHLPWIHDGASAVLRADRWKVKDIRGVQEDRETIDWRQGRERTTILSPCSRSVFFFHRHIAYKGALHTKLRGQREKISGMAAKWNSASVQAQNHHNSQATRISFMGWLSS